MARRLAHRLAHIGGVGGARDGPFTHRGPRDGPALPAAPAAADPFTNELGARTPVRCHDRGIAFTHGHGVRANDPGSRSWMDGTTVPPPHRPGDRNACDLFDERLW